MSVGSNTCPEPLTVGERIVPILFLTGMFFLSFVSRVVFSPLMPFIENEMGITHGQAGSLFLTMSIGFFVSMASSGLVSSRLTHRHTIVLSSGLLGAALILFSWEGNLAILRLNMFLLGVATGFYTPSGVAILSALVSHRDIGKAMGIHNTAPNLSYILAPLLCQAFLGWIHWRTLLVFLGLLALAASASFAMFQKEGSFRGEPPRPAALANLGARPLFWAMILLFCLALSGGVGIYAVLPLYLVKERGLDLNLANTLLSLSRVSGLFMVFFAGWVHGQGGGKEDHPRSDPPGRGGNRPAGPGFGTTAPGHGLSTAGDCFMLFPGWIQGPFSDRTAQHEKSGHRMGDSFRLPLRRRRGTRLHRGTGDLPEFFDRHPDHGYFHGLRELCGASSQIRGL